MSVKCPVLNVFWFLSKRWMLLILKTIGEWKETFWDIKRSLYWISSRILSERLQELQNEGYIDRTIINEKPVKIRYSLTKKWESLWVCLGYIEEWAKNNW